MAEALAGVCAVLAFGGGIQLALPAACNAANVDVGLLGALLLKELPERVLKKSQWGLGAGMRVPLEFYEGCLPMLAQDCRLRCLQMDRTF